MSRYRKIDTRIWNDGKFATLDDKGKLVFFMLLTHPAMTALGAMRATPSGLAEELGWPVEAFREAFREVLAKGMAKHDERVHLIALPNFVKYNPPESPNVIKAWNGALDLLPECPLKTEVIQRAKGYAEGMSKAFAKALPEAFAKAMPYQEQEQEQEQEEIPHGEESLALTRESESFIDEGGQFANLADVQTEDEFREYLAGSFGDQGFPPDVTESLVQRWRAGTFKDADAIRERSRLSANDDAGEPAAREPDEISGYAAASQGR